MEPIFPEWFFTGLIGLIGTALVVAGAGLGHFLSARSAKIAAVTQAAAQVEVAQRTAEATVAVAEKSSEQSMIDQLQEELSGYRAMAEANRKAADDRATAQDQRMERIEHENDLLRREREGYRSYAHVLRDHIIEELPPPPPAWPQNLPR